MHRSASLAFVVLLAPSLASQSSLEAGFRDPPASARPHTWWHWLNGNISRDGITKDLEAMHAVGLAGAQIFNVSEGIPKGPVLFQSPEWRALLHHAASEAERLGLELCMHDCAGWSSSGGPWITPDQAMQMLVCSELHVVGPAKFAGVLPQPETKLGFYRDIAVLALPTPADDRTRIDDIRPKAGYEARYGQDPSPAEYPAAAVVPRSAVVDVTASLAADGSLTWDVPPGDWTVLRFGYTPTGAVNAPSPDSGRGLECDKLSRRGMDAHWAGMMAPVLEALGPLCGTALRNLLIDSYEVGAQNWTADFREQFRRRRGYDLLTWLPATTGRVLDSGLDSERFLWDLRRTIGDLFRDEYYGRFVELCHQHGLLASIEPYDGPFPCLEVGEGADVPMGEFWVGGGESSSCKLAASVAHLHARSVVGAESFTAGPSQGKWQGHPAALKAVGDLMFSTGVNRCIIHRYAHQPWSAEVVPGMTMGQWGTHFERTNTWWTQGAAWLQYLARCQFLLQQGRFVADVLFCVGEASPNGAPLRPECKAAGYDYDSCAADVVMQLGVEDGSVVHPSGMRYRVLVLPDSTCMSTALLAKVRELVRAGATVIGPRPVRAPSLADDDARVRALALEVWGDGAGEGHAISGRSAPDVLAALGVPPDCEFAAASRPKLCFLHRRVGDADVYFVSNQKARAEDVDCTFRVAGRLPELWQPTDGSTAPAAAWDERDGRTTVRVPLAAHGSVFVVFRAPAPTRHLGCWPLQRAAGPRVEIRSARYEAVDGTGGADVTDEVRELVAQGETGIPATNDLFGDPTYNHVKRLVVAFTVDGVEQEGSARENQTLELCPAPAVAPLPAFVLQGRGDGGVELLGFEAGEHRIPRAGADAVAVKVPAPRPDRRIEGPWTVRFQAGRGAPDRIELPALRSWTEIPDPGVRWFSGTARYETGFDVPELDAAAEAVFLDLGDVQVIAEVTLNGVDLGTWWQPPFRRDVTRMLRLGHNDLQVRVTNLWVNRLIGDEQLPPDCEWNGIVLKQWPDWLLQGSPRPSSQRVTFTTWHHWTKDAAPLPSGLLGPVVLRTAARVPVPVGGR